jgi:REP element-mobilizing transposase RayT
MVLSKHGRVTATAWRRIPRHFPHVRLDAWVVMPDHVHGIIVIVDDRVPPHPATTAPGDVPTMDNDMARVAPTDPTDGVVPASAAVGRGSQTQPAMPIGPPPGSLGTIVGNFKSVTTRRINRMRKTPGARLWQSNYYEHIVRDENDLQRIREYIRANPARWEEEHERSHQTGMLGDIIASASKEAS